MLLYTDINRLTYQLLAIGSLFFIAMIIAVPLFH
jgi:hypothetical protein